MAGNLTIGALLTQGATRLRQAQGTGPRGGGAAHAAIANAAPDHAGFNLDAEVLLAHALSMNRTQLKTHPENVPSPERAQRYTDFIARRAAGEPVAYILGYKDFWTLRLAVTPAVLVPRPDTELLVERALALGPDGPARVVDLGTGSGAIALAIAQERPGWAVAATDLSEDALAVARSNAAMLGLGRVEFMTGRWFESVVARRFDLIVSNPPYIAEVDPALQDPALGREPRLALTAGADGMDALKEIVRSAPHHLERRGWLVLEHGADQAAAVARELVVRGFGHVRSHRDLAGHERTTEAQWI
jgi:release factor glutamine methyltransferase